MNNQFPIFDFDTPPLLSQISDPPKKLFIRGTFPSHEYKFLSVVGSRTYTIYGKQVCEKIIAELRGYPIVIVSGLALGIDGIAHRAALSAGLHTVAIPGSGLDDRVLYPRIHKTLAYDILSAGGALVSEFEPLFKPRPESFPQRNRIMAGLSHAVLVVEAEVRSGTLITSRLASEYNRDVCAVPGPIHSATAEGPHMLIQKGAALITKGEDILALFGLDVQTDKATTKKKLTPQEKLVYDHLKEPRSRDELVRTLGLPVSETNVLLSSLELRGMIHERLGFVEWVE